jgi:uncharacterized protein YbjT (DUF2867 family)
MNSAPVAITVGTGKIGSRVARRLADLGVQTRVGSRSSSTPFDWADPATWGPFVAGCSSAFVVFVPDLGFPGADDAVAEFGRQCRGAGVEHVVLLSGRGEPGALEAEGRLAATAGPITVVRCSWFHQNFSESFLLDPVLDGVIALPSGDVAEPFVDADDIADVVVACLNGAERLRGRTHELTGPELLSFHDVARILATATGREIRYLPVTVDAYVTAACDAGIHVDEAHAFAHLFHDITDGRNAHLTGDIAEVLGRPPRSFAGYAHATAATGAWVR